MSHVVESGARPHSALCEFAIGYRLLDPPYRREGRAALLVSCIMVAVYCFIALRGGLGRTVQIEHVDLNVYRAGARTLLDGGDLRAAGRPARLARDRGHARRAGAAP